MIVVPSLPHIASILLGIAGTLVSTLGCAPASGPRQPPPARSASIAGADHERRDQEVDADDLRILERADAILSSDAVWNRADDRRCPEGATRWSLYCALHQASLDVLGRYEHRRVALQEVRFAVEEATRGRDFEHRLMDFNNLPETRLADIKHVLRVAIDRVRARLRARP